MVDDGDLDVPASNREIALHLRTINSRLTSLEESFSEFQTSIGERRFRLQDVLMSSLVLPLVGGMLLFLLTKAFS
jgi:hypothetical protein